MTIPPSAPINQVPQLQESDRLSLTLSLGTIDSILASLCEQVYDWACTDTLGNDYAVLRTRARDIMILSEEASRAAIDHAKASAKRLQSSAALQQDELSCITPTRQER